jgi:16S rRNA (guanine(966)-N(2))-methyltransferase RsmD
MRVIAGTLRGRRLKTPSWDGLRPTSDKLRETLFNILAPRIAGARVLDGYAGTGALGIEALSRGARFVTFVERDRRAQALIAENLALCGITDGCAIIRTAIVRALDTLRDHPAFERFDIVLFDPPYAPASRDIFESLVAAAGSVMTGTGVLALEHAKRYQAPDTSGPLILSRTVVSGDSALSFYEVRGPLAPVLPAGR